eukprot:8647408-Pyramimonas_sp.AAC.1
MTEYSFAPVCNRTGRCSPNSGTYLATERDPRQDRLWRRATNIFSGSSGCFIMDGVYGRAWCIRGAHETNAPTPGEATRTCVCGPRGNPRGYGVFSGRGIRMAGFGECEREAG